MNKKLKKALIDSVFNEGRLLSDMATKDKKMAELQEVFDEAKEALKLICKAQIRNADRIDNFWRTYQDLEKFEILPSNGAGSKAFDMVNKACDEEKANYEQALEILEDLTLDHMIAEEWVDPVAPFIPDRFGVTDKSALYSAYMVFVCLRPYGEKIEQLRNNLMEMKEAVED